MHFIAIPWKNLRRRKVRSIATVTGFVVAIGTMVALLAVAQGFESSFAEIFTKRGVDLLVIRAGGGQRVGSLLDESIAKQLQALPRVTRVVGGIVDMVSLDGGLAGAPVNGVPPNSPFLAGLRVTEGRGLQESDKRAAIIGSLLAERFAKRSGDTLDIAGELQTVVGVFESANVYENGAIYVPLETLQALLGLTGKVNGFAVVTDKAEGSPDSIERLREQIRALRDGDGRPMKLDALPVQDYVSTMKEIQATHAMAWAISTMALLLGSIAAFNTMAMSVAEQVRELGILRAIGWRRRRIVGLVVLESTLLALVGSLLGIALGAFVVVILGQLPATSAIISGVVTWRAVAWSLLAGVGVGLAAGAYPARWAASLIPAEAIRGG